MDGWMMGGWEKEETRRGACLEGTLLVVTSPVAYLQRPPLPAVPGVDGDQAVEGRLLAAEALEADLWVEWRKKG